MLKKMKAASLCAIVGVLGLSSPSHARKIMVDVNQFSLNDYNYLVQPANRTKLSCDGTWCFFPNSPGITDAMWSATVSYIGSGRLASEDGHSPQASNYNRVMQAIGRVDDAMSYHEPNVSLSSLAEVQAAAASHGGKVMVLSRDYTGNNAATVNALVNHNLVTGVTFEIGVAPNGGQNTFNRKIGDGIRYAIHPKLGRGAKNVYILLSPGQSDLGTGYKAAVQNTVAALKSDLGTDWESPYLYLVLAAYETGRVKVTFFGSGGVADTLAWLKTQ